MPKSEKENGGPPEGERPQKEKTKKMGAPRRGNVPKKERYFGRAPRRGNVSAKKKSHAPWVGSLGTRPLTVQAGTREGCYRADQGVQWNREADSRFQLPSHHGDGPRGGGGRSTGRFVHPVGERRRLAYPTGW